MFKHATLEPGECYLNVNGIWYECVSVIDNDAYILKSSGGWELTAHNITRYQDGSIEWDYSTKGKFV